MRVGLCWIVQTVYYLLLMQLRTISHFIACNILSQIDVSMYDSDEDDDDDDKIVVKTNRREIQKRPKLEMWFTNFKRYHKERKLFPSQNIWWSLFLAQLHFIHAHCYMHFTKINGLLANSDSKPPLTPSLCSPLWSQSLFVARKHTHTQFFIA